MTSRKTYEKFILGAFAGLALFSFSACGRSASDLLRVGQLPVNDFPLYVSDRSAGAVYAYDRNGVRTTFLSGLNLPSGIATDKFKNLYVVENGASRVIKVNTATLAQKVYIDNLMNPGAIAVDSVGEVYVIQLDAQNIVRGKNRTVVGTGFVNPTAIAIGVNDRLIIGDSFFNRVYWGNSTAASSAYVILPAGISLDQSGRVYAAEGDTSLARVVRFHQSEPGDSPYEVALSYNTPVAIAVDPVGNAYILEKTGFRIVIKTIKGELKSFGSAYTLVNPESMAFTQY